MVTVAASGGPRRASPHLLHLVIGTGRKACGSGWTGSSALGACRANTPSTTPPTRTRSNIAVAHSRP
eukprot:1054892-Rhodomonas_salina.1